MFITIYPNRSKFAHKAAYTGSCLILTAETNNNVIMLCYRRANIVPNNKRIRGLPPKIQVTNFETTIC